MSSYLFTSEAVSSGHPDKTCDIISDSLVDYCIGLEPEARCAFECLVSTDLVVVAGEYRLKEYDLTDEEVESIVRRTLKRIGHTQEKFSWDTVKIQIEIKLQSEEIALGVDETENKPEGAGDQGLMFGFACKETESLMPLPIVLAHKILKEVLKIEGYGPDAKSQVTVGYVDGKPKFVDTVVVSVQHPKDVSLETVREKVREAIDRVVVPNRYCINTAGTFIVGGPVADVGLTGRKIIVDTYGGAAPHGGGAFSGKDPTKVDRSAAYMARYLAKNVVASGLAEKCLVQLSYAIGVDRVVSLMVDFQGTGKEETQTKVAKWIMENVDTSPAGIRKRFNLNRPIYEVTASYGHFGRSTEEGLFPWESLDLVEDLGQLK